MEGGSCGHVMDLNTTFGREEGRRREGAGLNGMEEEIEGESGSAVVRVLVRGIKRDGMSQLWCLMFVRQCDTSQMRESGVLDNGSLSDGERFELVGGSSLVFGSESSIVL